MATPTTNRPAPSSGLRRFAVRLDGGRFAAFGRVPARLLAAPYRAWVGFHAVEAGDRAAAVAFNALLALIPLILVVVSLGGLALQADDLLQATLHALLWAVPEADADAAIDALLQAREGSGVLGLVGLIGFAWAGSNFVLCLARSLNRVYGAPDRHLVHERLRAVAIVAVLAVFALAAFFLATLPTLFVRGDVAPVFAAWALAQVELKVASYLVAVAAALALFFSIYRVLPNAGQRLRDVWPGSATATLLFVLLLQAFPIYLRLVGGASRYGAFFGFIPLLVVWFSALAHVLLFGAYVNASYHRRCLGAAEIAGFDLPGCPGDERSEREQAELGRS